MIEVVFLYTFLLIATAVVFFFILILIPLALAIIRGAPYAGIPAERLKVLVDLAHVKPGDRAIDLGAGDGRIVIALARAGAEAHGYEVNPWLVLLSRYNIRRAKLRKKAHVHWRSMWRQNLSQFDVITVFGVPYIMEGLEKKIIAEAKDQARVISNSYPFPTWEPEREMHGVYLYTK